jgi:hypothetical protein
MASKYTYRETTLLLSVALALSACERGGEDTTASANVAPAAATAEAMPALA